MKISKLFHWLYAFVMFLPIFAIGVTCLIYTFNSQAKESAKINYKYETNDVNSLTDLKPGNIYTLTLTEENINEEHYCYVYAVYNIDYGIDFKADYENKISYFDIWRSGSTKNLFLAYNANNIFTYNASSITYPFKLDIVYTSNATDYTLFSRSNYNEIESVSNNLDVNSIFYNAVDKVTESPLFSWAYDSFLVAPFAYIVALFGMPTNSVIVQLLSYWLAISIIWLVFDLIMYVPLLVHRWIDKGILE